MAGNVGQSMCNSVSGEESLDGIAAALIPDFFKPFVCESLVLICHVIRPPMLT
jgi:hypothetical protein